MKLRFSVRTVLPLLVAACAVGLFPARASAQYMNKVLVANSPSFSPVSVDPGLLNGWGLAALPNTPFWVAAQNSSSLRIYKGNGSKLNAFNVPCVRSNTLETTCDTTPLFEPLEGDFNFFGPTGLVANPHIANGAFKMADGKPAWYIADTLGGLIVAWNPSTGAAKMMVNNAPLHYAGLAVAGPANDPHLYATKRAVGGNVQVFNSKFQMVSSFTPDRNVPTPDAHEAFAPYGIEAIGDKLYVTYFNTKGLGGIIDVCDLATSPLQPECHRLYASNLSGMEAMPVLESPWGMAMAPHNFGPYSNMLLVGNVRSGMIRVFNPDTGHLMGTLMLQNGTPFLMPGLWDMQFGSGAAAQGPTNDLFYAAGPPTPGMPQTLFANGVFGVIAPPAMHMATSPATH